MKCTKISPYMLLIAIVIITVINVFVYKFEVASRFILSKGDQRKTDPLTVANLIWTKSIGKEESPMHAALKQLTPYFPSFSMHVIENKFSSSNSMFVTMNTVNTVVNELTFYTMYQYIDDAVIDIRSFIKANPRKMIVWSIPSEILATIAKQEQTFELELTFYYLIYKHIVLKYQVFVIPESLCPTHPVVDPSNAFDFPPDCLHTYINHQLTVLYDYLVHQKYPQILTCPIMAQGCVLSILEQYLSTTREQNENTNTNTNNNNHNNNKKKMKKQQPPPAKKSLHETCFKFVNTRKYLADCMPEPDELYPILITGLGGSGTHYLATELQALGFRINHEDIGSDGSVSWLYAVNDWLGKVDYPYGTLEESSYLNPRFHHVYHVIRSPLKQISSVTAHTNKTYQFIYDSLTHIEPYRSESTPIFDQAKTIQSSCYRGGKCHLPFAVASWVYWNDFVASYAEKTYRIEYDTDRLLNDVCEQLWPEFRAIAGDETCVEKRKMQIDHSLYLQLNEFYVKKSYNSKPIHREHSQYEYKDLDFSNIKLKEKFLEKVKQFNYTVS